MRLTYPAFRTSFLWVLAVIATVTSWSCAHRHDVAPATVAEAPKAQSQPAISPTSPQQEASQTPWDTLRFTHTAAEVGAFLDSVARLSPRKLAHYAAWDSVPPAYPPLRRQLSETLYRQLRSGCKKGRISLHLAKQLKLQIEDWPLENDSVPVELQPLGQGNTYFAVVSYPKYKWFSKVAFFKGQELVEVHDVHPGFSFKVRMYADAQGHWVINYPDMENEAMGAWQFVRHYYHWEDGRLRPVLRTLDEGRWGNSTRDFWLNAQQVRDDSLTIRFTYDQLLRTDLRGMVEYEDDSLVPLIHGAARLEFVYDTLTQRYAADWGQSRLTYWQMLTYLSCENEHLFLRTHAATLRRCLRGKDRVKRHAVHQYLCEVMDGEYPKGENARW